MNARFKPAKTSRTAALRLKGRMPLKRITRVILHHGYRTITPQADSASSAPVAAISSVVGAIMARERPTPPLLQGHGRARRLNHQAVDDRDADGAKPGFASETEANLKRPIPNHGTKGSKGYLGVIRYSIVTCQFANAGTVYGGDRRKDM